MENRKVTAIPGKPQLVRIEKQQNANYSDGSQVDNLNDSRQNEVVSFLNTLKFNHMHVCIMYVCMHACMYVCMYARMLILSTVSIVLKYTKVNQTGCGVYHGCLEFKTERIFGIACLGKS